MSLPPPPLFFARVFTAPRNTHTRRHCAIKLVPCCVPQQWQMAIGLSISRSVVLPRTLFLEEWNQFAITAHVLFWIGDPRFSMTRSAQSGTTYEQTCFNIQTTSGPSA